MPVNTKVEGFEINFEINAKRCNIESVYTNHIKDN